MVFSSRSAFKLTLALCSGLTATNLSAESINFEDIEGIWTNEPQRPKFETTLSITNSGALFQVSPQFGRCIYVISPENVNGEHSAYLIKDSRNQCRSDKARIQIVDNALSFGLVGQWGTTTISLFKTIGTSLPDRAYPTANIKGVTLGRSLEDGQTASDGDLRFSGLRSSRNVVRGVRQLDGRYIQGTLAHEGELAQLNAAQDVIGLYTIGDKKDDPIAAILRTWAPAPTEAPSATRFIDALINTYGRPSKRDQSGPYTYLAWFYDQNGQPASQNIIAACAMKVTHRTYKRRIAMLFNRVQFHVSGRVEEKESINQIDLAPLKHCGYALRYTVKGRKDGILETASGSLFDHRAIAHSIWSEERSALDDKIARNLLEIASSQENAPEL